MNTSAQDIVAQAKVPQAITQVEGKEANAEVVALYVKKDLNYPVIQMNPS